MKKVKLIRHCEQSEAISTFIPNDFKYLQKFFCLLSFILILFLSSCEKDIEIKVPETEKKLVVEGHVEPGQNPYVILTRTASFFAPTDSAALVNSIVFDATVIVSDGTTSETMTLALDFNYFPPIVYKAQNMVGVEGKTYTLTITTGGKTYSSTTVIPSIQPLDSTWFKLQGTSDSLGFAWAHLTDPAGSGNAFRWFAKRIGKDSTFIAPLGSSFDDKFIEGKSFDFAYNRGESPNSESEDDNNDERGYFKKGDTIIIKFCTIDQASFEFYRTFEVGVSNNGNPFASPISVQTNISGGALGIWGGYGAFYDTIIAR